MELEGKSTGELFKIAGDLYANELDPEEQKRWRIALIIGVTAGFLSRHRLDEDYDPENPTHDVHHATRIAGRDKLEAFIADNSDETALSYVREGLSLLITEYEGVVADYPDLENDLEALRMADTWMNSVVEADECVAHEIMTQAGLLFAS